MAAGRLILPPYFPARDRNARLVPGALLAVYADGTTTKAAIYADEGLTTPQVNPAPANASGQFPPIWCEAGTVEDPVLYTLAISGPNGESIGNPATFTGWQPSLDSTTAQVALAEAAAEAAQAYYEDILDLEGIADPSIAIATRAAKAANGSDFANPALVRTNIGADLAQNVNTSQNALTGAVTRDQRDRNADRVSVFDFMTAAQRADVRARTKTLDHTAAFQAAIDSAIAKRHELFVPWGDYSVTGLSVDLSGTPSSLGFRMSGAGRTASRIYKRGITTDPILDIEHLSTLQTVNVDPTDFGVYGNAKVSSGIRIKNCASALPRNIWVQDCDIGIDWLGGNSNLLDGVVIVGCNRATRFDQNGSGTSYANDITLKNCRFSDNKHFAVDFGGGSNLRLVQCDIESNGTPKATVTISNASPAVISWTAHGLLANMEVQFTSTGGLPAGLTAGTSYFVRSTGLTANTFQVSATKGGSAVNTSSAGSGVHTGHAVGTGAFMVRSTAEAEIGYAIISVDGCWFEGNKGRSIQLETFTAGRMFLQLSNTNILSSENGRAFYSAGGGIFVFANVVAPSSGDTFTANCDRLTIKGGIIDTLNGTQGYRLLLNAGLATPIEGNIQSDVHLGGGFQFKQTWVGGAAGYQLGPNTNNGRYYFLKTGTAAGVYEFDGDIYRDGVKVVSTRGSALPADATDLASALALVNAIKARLKVTGGHGLVAD